MHKLTLLLALTTVSASAEAPRTEPTRCTAGAGNTQSRTTQPPRVRPLIEMPDARPVLAVYRQVAGCNVLLVRENGRIIEEPVNRPETRRVFRP